MADDLHKTEKGGVRLDLKDAAALQEAFTGMQGESFVVQKMSPAGQEVILGVKRDAEFGPVLLFGLGGTLVELMRDIVIRVLPIDEYEAERMVDECKGAPLLRGFRGAPPADRENLVRCMIALSRLACDHPDINTIDVNPLIVLGKGKGCLAVDAKIETLL